MNLIPFYHYYFNPVGQPWWMGAVWGNILASAILGVSIFYTIYRKRLKCKKCWRISVHPVKGTHYHTCHKHSTVSWHAALRAMHAEKHPEEHRLLNDAYEV